MRYLYIIGLLAFLLYLGISIVSIINTYRRIDSMQCESNERN